MPQFDVDEDLAALVERLAKPKPFENLSFSAALRRVLNEHIEHFDLEQLLTESMLARKEPKKALSPNPQQWATSVPELRSEKHLNSWQAICNLLKIDTAGDSARRKLKNWVKTNQSKWPPVPGIN